MVAVGPFYRASNNLPPDSLYKTTNGGNNWYAMALPNSLTYYDWPIDFSIIGENKIWFCSSYGKILCTTDGGLNWQLQFYDTTMTKCMNYIEMFDSLNGMAMGDAPDNKPALFLKTTNGGVDWISQNDSSLIGFYQANVWRGVDFVNMSIGYVGGHIPNQYGRKLYKTTNGGKDWEFISDTIACAVIKAYDENLLLGEEGSTVSGFLDRTLDGGQTWESGRWDFMQWGLDIEYITNKPSDVWLVSRSICFSSDTGRTWTAEFENGDILFEDIVFIDENYGWLFGANRGIHQEFFIYRTTNGGHGGIVSVDESKTNFKICNFTLEQNYPNPFNPSTTIKYKIPKLDFVTLKVYDVLGNKVTTLVSEELPAGEHEVEFGVAQISNLSSRIYFYQLKVYPANSGAVDFIQTRKMVIIK